MGCIRKIFQILILALALIGFTSIGGKDFLVQQYENYFGTTKESTMERASKLGDFSHLDIKVFWQNIMLLDKKC